MIALHTNSRFVRGLRLMCGVVACVSALFGHLYLFAFSMLIMGLLRGYEACAAALLFDLLYAGPTLLGTEWVATTLTLLFFFGRALIEHAVAFAARPALFHTYGKT